MTSQSTVKNIPTNNGYLFTQNLSPTKYLLYCLGVEGRGRGWVGQQFLNLVQNCIMLFNYNFLHVINVWQCYVKSNIILFVKGAKGANYSVR